MLNMYSFSHSAGLRQTALSGTGKKNMGAHIAVNDEHRNIAVHPAYLFKMRNLETMFQMARLAQAAAAFQVRSNKGAPPFLAHCLDGLVGEL